jgi:hypothetical protein
MRVRVLQNPVKKCEERIMDIPHPINVGDNADEDTPHRESS